MKRLRAARRGRVRRGSRDAPLADTCNRDHLYDRIYALVRQVPRGRVVSYGQVAEMVGGCTPRQVGYAMAAVTAESNVPWQRVINSQGRISERAGGGECVAQRQLLEQEGVRFSAADRVDFARFGWLEAGGTEGG